MKRYPAVVSLCGWPGTAISGKSRASARVNFSVATPSATLEVMGGDFSALEILLRRSKHEVQQLREAPQSTQVSGEVQRHVSQLAAREAKFGRWPEWADPALITAWESTGVSAPWIHQVAAAESLFSGRTTLLATATGSGKSLSYWLPALTRARLDRGAGYGTTLYLAPTKALAGDQLSAVNRILRAGNITDVSAATVDGDTGFEQRVWAQSHAQVVLTNPDMLHHSILPNHARWRVVLRNLQFIIIDEAHAYRGVFGAHVALVLRRLLRIAAHYGAQPTIALASATTAQPQLSAARLLGLEPAAVNLIEDDASPRGEQALVLWEPAPLAVPGAEGTDEAWTTRSATNEAAHLLAELVSFGVRTLVFARSRSGAENIAEVARSLLRDRPGAEHLADRIASYRGGYLAEERRALEAALRSGEVLGMASTNALELGVDISGLDAVLISGWPGTRVSVWQQAGRAGRAGEAGVAVFISRPDPLDSYLVHNPQALLEAPLESTTFDPTNPYVLAPHLCAAAAELPVQEADLYLFAAPNASAAAVEQVLSLLVAQGALRARDTGWYWTRRERASNLTSLRGVAAPVTIIGAGSGEVIGTIDGGAADAQVHEGAVYVHQGDTYLVDIYDPDDGIAAVRKARLPYWTLALSDSDIHVLQEKRSFAWGPIKWHLGLVEVTSQVTRFQQRSRRDGGILDTKNLQLPQRTLTTVGCWWTVPQSVLEACQILPNEIAGALHAAEHAAIGVLPLLATCDRWDIGGVASPLHRDTEMATVFVHDGISGGAGFAERGFEMAEEWIRATHSVIAQCPCQDGCPSCIQSPKCGSNNSPLDKATALRLLNELLRYAH